MSVPDTSARSVPAAPPRRARGRARAEPPVPEPGSVTGSSPGRLLPLPAGRRCGRSAARPPLRSAGRGAGAALPAPFPHRHTGRHGRWGPGGRQAGGEGEALVARKICLPFSFPAASKQGHELCWALLRGG